MNWIVMTGVVVLAGFGEYEIRFAENTGIAVRLTVKFTVPPADKVCGLAEVILAV